MSTNSIEFKKLSDVNVIESISDTLNVLVEDNGEVVKIAANNLVPEDVVTQSEMEEAIAAIPEGFSGSWNDLQDRPFYEEANAITWDGNKDGLVHVLFDHPTSGNDWGDYNFYKVSDAIPDVKVGDTVTVLDGDGGSLGLCELAQENENILTTTTGNREFVIVLSDNADYSFTFYADYSGTFPEAGVYFRDVLDSTGGIRPRTGSVDFGPIVHRIDPKFIDGGNFIINLTKNSDGTTYSADMTFEEVEAAIGAGRVAYVRFNAYINKVQSEITLPSTFRQSWDAVYFGGILPIDDGCEYYLIKYDWEGNITLATKTLTATE